MNRRSTIKWTLQGFTFLSLSPFISCNKVSNKEATSNMHTLLSQNQINILNILADFIIPTCDISPSASSVGIASALDQTLFHFYNKNNQNQVLNGLNNIDKLSIQLHNRTLIETKKEEQFKVIEYLVNDSRNSKTPENHLFFILRRLVIAAYFQSSYISEKVLRYDPIPGSYSGCVDLSDNDYNWSL